MLLMITQGSMWKALLDVLQGKRTVLKASYCHSERHSQGPAFACKRQSRGGRSMSHTPRLRTANQSGAAHQPYGDTGRHMFHSSARGAEHCALWDTLLHPQLPLPLETRTGSYTHPCEHGQCRRGKQHGRQPRVCHPARSQESCSSLGAGHAASLAIPVPPCAAERSTPALRKALQSYRIPWHRSRMHTETMAIRPQNEHLDLKTTNKQKSPHNNKPHTHT